MTPQNHYVVVAGIKFFEAPSHVEGSPYWVDLWASVNGYRIGLQVKPQTYNSANMAIYVGKARSGQKKGHKLFQEQFGGRVFTADISKGRVSKLVEEGIHQEVTRLETLEHGPYDELE